MKTGWNTPSDMESEKLGSNQNTTKPFNMIQRRYTGMFAVTDKAYLFGISDKEGMWVPRSLCFDIQFNPYNSTITAWIPDFCTSVKRVPL